MTTNLLLSKNLSNELSTANYMFQNKSEKLNELEGITTVNVFVGANNSGKSRFARGMMKMEQYYLISNKYKQLKNELIVTLSEIEENFTERSHISFLYHQNAKHPRLTREFELLNSKKITNQGSDINLKFDKNFISEIKNFLNSFTYNYDNDNDRIKIELKYFCGAILVIRGILNDKYVIRTNNYHSFTARLSRFGANEVSLIIEKSSKAIKIIEEILEDKIETQTPTKIYIPTLRSAKTIIGQGISTEHLYFDTLKQTYFSESNDFEKTWTSLKIFTGLDFYKEVKKVRNSKRTIRKSFEKFEQFLKKSFFNDKEIDIVALEEKRHLSFYLDDEDLEIHNLGDGIQALIVLMFPIFTAEKNSWIFIDEPELHLHPGMQRLFLEQILSNSEIKQKGLRFFITTHSNHFLDLAIPNEDVSIYSFSKLIGSKAKEHKFLIRNVKPGDSSLLTELGVNNSSVFMANCSVWVEGVTDRKYVSAFLYAYIKKVKKEYFFKEDVDYTFFQYAGSNLSHYFFTDKLNLDEKREIKELINGFAISNRIYLLADKDGPNKKSKHSFLKSISKDNKNFSYQHTQAIEIENLLSFPIIKKILIDVLNQDENIINNIHNISEDDYYQIPMGEFLNKRLGSRKGINLPKITDNSKTLNSRYKLKFANYVFEEVLSGNITWDLISQNKHAKKITMDICKFIEKYKDNR